MAALNEEQQVELPLIEQLKGMGWRHLPGDIDVPYLTERESFREVLLRDRLRASLKRINLDDDGRPWLGDGRANQALGALERLGAPRLMEANQLATELLLKGTSVEAPADDAGNRERSVKFIDFDHPERNDFLVINQFRVDPPWAVGGKGFIIPDLVLFVNGIPLVVIECKSPSATNPMLDAIDQLMRYANQREWVEQDEGAERLFHYNQFNVATFGYQARVGTFTATPEHYLEWKDTSPVAMEEVCRELGVEKLTSQQTLVAGMLRPAHLLDIVRNFTLYQQAGGRTIKIVGRYQQFRAVQKAICRLQQGQTRAEHGESDQRGGIIWHTQGSGKSLTMVFLVRKLRTLPDLRRFKVVIVTDRTDLEKQLAATATLTEETVRKATSTRKLKELLSQPGADLVFAMIQKYQERDDVAEVIALTPGPSPRGRGEKSPLPLGEGLGEGRMVADGRGNYSAEPERLTLADAAFPVLNESEEILVMVDEAHRSQASQLHANLMRALPNCARIGSTGTPVIVGERKRTHEIFGSFIDRYTIKQSEEDGATLPILYEGRTAEGEVADGGNLDRLFEDMFKDRSQEELEAIKARYAAKGNVLEAPKLIAAKAGDMLRHYIDNILPNGFKAQVVTVSRLAAVRYHEALLEAKRQLLEALEALDAKFLGLDAEALERQDDKIRFLVRAHPYRGTIGQLDFAVIISGSHNDDPAWKEWTDKSKQDARIERFRKPLFAEDPAKCDGLAFLIVKSMLLTGFDAPVEQVLYLDRSIRDHDLLQAIARVNRTCPDKHCGLVVDYYGVGHHLKEALAVYADEDVAGALTSIEDELPILSDRHQRVIAVFRDRGLADIKDVNACVDLLRNKAVRAEFVVKLKKFLESLDVVMPRPEALPYVRDARILGFINKAAANLYRDDQLNIAGCGAKVRQLIDEHIESCGIDPRVPPVSILADDFEEVVGQHKSRRAQASEMEHAARYHIRKHFNEDPVYYRKLSEKLEDILKQFADQWDELVEALRAFTREVQAGRQGDPTGTGLQLETEVPFFELLAEEAGAGDSLPAGALTRLANTTIELVEHLGQEIRLVDFWRTPQMQHRLRGWIVDFLDDNDLVPFGTQEKCADRIIELARNRHAWLTQ